MSKRSYIVLDELDALTEQLDKEIKDINKSISDSNTKTGDIGELFIKWAVRESMWRKQYKLADEGNMTFYTTPK